MDVDKLKQLKQLYDSGALTEEEFTKLKGDIIKSNVSTGHHANSSPMSQVMLRLSTFKGVQGKVIVAPKIQSGLDSLDENDIVTLKRFLRYKLEYVDVSAFTSDEKKFVDAHLVSEVETLQEKYHSRNSFLNKWKKPTLYFGILLALGAGIGWLTDDDDQKTKTKSTTSTTSTSFELHTPPEGYKRGLSCNSCLGTGKTAAHDSEIGYYGGVCASCNGKGYNWVKK